MVFGASDLTGKVSEGLRRTIGLDVKRAYGAAPSNDGAKRQRISHGGNHRFSGLTGPQRYHPFQHMGEAAGQSAASSFARSYASASPSSPAFLATSSLGLAARSGGHHYLGGTCSSPFSSSVTGAPAAAASWNSAGGVLTQQQIDAMVTEDIDKYENDDEYRQLVDYAVETAESGVDITIDMEVEPATPPEEQHDSVGAGTEDSTDTGGDEGGIQDMEVALDDLQILQGDEVEGIADGGESEHPLQQPPGNGGEDAMNAGNDEGNNGQPPGNQDAEMNSGEAPTGGGEDGQVEGMEVDEPTDAAFVPATHSVEMNSHVKLQMPPPDVPIPTEQERPVLVTRAQSAQQAVRRIVETRIQYEERGESYMEPILANLDPDFFDDVPTADLARAGLFNGEVSYYSLEYLQRAAQKNPVPRGGVRPLAQNEYEDEDEDEEHYDGEDYMYGDDDEEEEDNDTLERFGDIKCGNMYLFQYIRPTIEENGKAIVALLNRG